MQQQTSTEDATEEERGSKMEEVEEEEREQKDEHTEKPDESGVVVDEAEEAE
jgi:hypothetical protein